MLHSLVSLSDRLSRVADMPSLSRYSGQLPAVRLVLSQLGNDHLILLTHSYGTVFQMSLRLHHQVTV